MEPESAVQQPLVPVPDGLVLLPTERSDEHTKTERVQNFLPQNFILKPFAWLVTTSLLIGLAWLSTVILCERLKVAATGLLLFGSMILSSYLSGQLCQLCGLPAVVPMYALGMTFRHFNLLKEAHNWAVFMNLRYLAITVVLVKGGLAMDLSTVKNYPAQVGQSSFLICTVEALAMTVAVRVFLPDMYPLLWAFVFGFVMAPTSPTKFITTLAELKTTRKYVNRKLQDIWSTSSVIEIIYCISVFSVLMTLITRHNETEITVLLLGGAKIGIGLVAGTVLGVILGYFPHKDDINSSVKRFVGLWLGVIAVYFGAKSHGWGPGGPVGTLVGGIWAGSIWSTIDPDDQKHVLKSFNKIWDWVMEPMLFSLVGYEMEATNLPISAREINLTIACLLIGCLSRIFISVCVYCTMGFEVRETLFLVIAGLPTATVQAAISPQLLDLLRGEEHGARAATLVFAGILHCCIVTTISTLILHYFSGKLLKGCGKSGKIVRNA